jgi:hypothetical protein
MMKKNLLLALTISVFPAANLWAIPGTVENFDYKINLSETMPGIDNAPATVGGPVINVDVTDKLRNNTTRFPLKVYSINEYFLAGDHLNLLCRTTLRDTTEQRFTLIQLDLANTSDSRQFNGLKKYYFSPDNQSLLGIFEVEGTGDSIGLIRLSKGPAGMGWLYSLGAKTNLFQMALPTIGNNLALASVVGWAGDGLTAAFILRGDEGTPDAPDLKYYLACFYLDEDRFRVAAQALDLSAYPIPEKGMIDQVECLGDKAILIFPPSNAFKSSKVTFQLPKPPAPKSK